MYNNKTKPYLISSSEALGGGALLKPNNIDFESAGIIQSNERYFGEFSDTGIEYLIKNLGIPITKIQGTFEKNGKKYHRVYIDGGLLE
jgi:hypothetical protein